jgi:UDP-glucuronate 4-epimerase
MTMSNCLVTGAAGFIGSQLCESLIERGDRVIGVDSFSDHYERELKELNLSTLRGSSQFVLVEADLASDEVRELFYGIDVVFHLAARPGVRDSWEAFGDYVDANIVGSRAIFDAAAATGTRVVYASSSSVYGNAPTLPVTEATPLKPISPYGASKVMTEVLAGAYASSFGLDAVGMRYFTVYGPRQRPDMGLSRFIEALVSGRPIPLYGDGLQRRDMTYVGDVVNATMLAAEHGKPGTAYNVASDSPRTLLDILSELADVLGVPLEVAREGNKPGDVRDTWGDIALAAGDLGYAPGTPLHEGLEAQVAEAERRREALGTVERVATP